ncbi:hypothetical protein [Microbacterium sp. P5_E9]
MTVHGILDGGRFELAPAGLAIVSTRRGLPSAHRRSTGIQRGFANVNLWISAQRRSGSEEGRKALALPLSVEVMCLFFMRTEDLVELVRLALRRALNSVDGIVNAIDGGLVGWVLFLSGLHFDLPHVGARARSAYTGHLENPWPALRCRR